MKNNCYLPFIIPNVASYKSTYPPFLCKVLHAGGKNTTDHDEQHEPSLINRSPAAAAGRRRRRRPLWRPPPLPPRPLLPPLEHRGMDDCLLRRHCCHSHGEVLVRYVNSRQLVLYKKAGTLSVSQLPNKCHCFS